jgi:hypothetical protein
MIVGFALAVAGCAPSPYERGGYPSGLTQAEVERDYMECEYKARLAYEPHLNHRIQPFPFGTGPRNPADRARALNDMSSIYAMRDTCLAAKGYRLH